MPSRDGPTFICRVAKLSSQVAGLSGATIHRKALSRGERRSVASYSQRRSSRCFLSFCSKFSGWLCKRNAYIKVPGGAYLTTISTIASNNAKQRQHAPCATTPMADAPRRSNRKPKPTQREVIPAAEHVPAKRKAKDVDPDAHVQHFMLQNPKSRLTKMNISVRCRLDP
jgi:hypothetical protein